MVIIRKPRTLPAGPRKIVHVNGQRIRQNKRDRTNRPVYTVKCAGRNYYCRSIRGQVNAVQNFHAPLPSGAVAWLQTTSALELLP